MSSDYHTPIAFHAPIASSVVNAPLGELDATLTGILDGTYYFTKLRVGTGGGEASAIMEMNSTTQGFLPPRMTTAQRDAIASPTNGLLIWNTDTNKLNYYEGSWQVVGSFGGGMTTLVPATTLTNVASMSETGISQSYQDLWLRLRIRSRATAENDNMFLRFNGDSTFAHYSFNNFYSQTGTINVYSAASDTKIGLKVPAANANAGGYLDICVKIFNYIEATDPIFGYMDGVLQDDIMYAFWGGLEWDAGDPIDEISLITESGANFDVVYSILGVGE